MGFFQQFLNEELARSLGRGGGGTQINSYKNRGTHVNSRVSLKEKKKKDKSNLHLCLRRPGRGKPKPNEQLKTR